MRTHDRTKSRSWKLTTGMLEVHNIVSARQFQADEGVQSIEDMEAVEKQLVCVSMNKLHGAMQDEDLKKCSLYNCFEAFQHIYRSSV